MEQFHAKGDFNNSYLLITGADCKDEFDVMLGLKNMEMLLNKIQLFVNLVTMIELLSFIFHLLEHLLHLHDFFNYALAFQ